MSDCGAKTSLADPFPLLPHGESRCRFSRFRCGGGETDNEQCGQLTRKKEISFDFWKRLSPRPSFMTRLGVVRRIDRTWRACTDFDLDW